MTILFDATRPVKSNRRFGRGILASLPVYHADHTAADEAWFSAEQARAENAHYDDLAADSAAISRHEAGFCC